MDIPLMVAGGMFAVLDLYATWAIIRNPSSTLVRKVMQTLIVWLVPLLGAIICIIFSRTDTLSSPASTRQEFFENVDASGSDH